jgi:hypothetical protein
MGGLVGTGIQEVQYEVKARFRFDEQATAAASIRFVG